MVYVRYGETQDGGALPVASFTSPCRNIVRRPLDRFNHFPTELPENRVPPCLLMLHSRPRGTTSFWQYLDNAKCAHGDRMIPDVGHLPRRPLLTQGCEARALADAVIGSAGAPRTDLDDAGSDVSKVSRELLEARALADIAR